MRGNYSIILLPSSPFKKYDVYRQPEKRGWQHTKVRAYQGLHSYPRLAAASISTVRTYILQYTNSPYLQSYWIFRRGQLAHLDHDVPFQMELLSGLHLSLREDNVFAPNRGESVGDFPGGNGQDICKAPKVTEMRASISVTTLWKMRCYLIQRATAYCCRLFLSADDSAGKIEVKCSQQQHTMTLTCARQL